MAHPKRAVSEPQFGTAYEGDPVAWSREQAAHLRRRDRSKLDRPHPIEEAEAFGCAERKALTSAPRIVLLHIRRRDRQPDHRSRSCVTSMRVRRLAVDEGLADDPSLGGPMEDLRPSGAEAGISS